MDLKDIDFSEFKPTEQTFEITSPATGEPIGLRFTMMSFDDDRMKRTRRQIRDKRIQLEKKNKAFSAVEEESNQNALMYQAITRWEWYGSMLEKVGEEPPLNPANFNYILDQIVLVRNQLIEKFNENEGFFTT